MDMKEYYDELKKMESEIEGRDIYVSSLATPDGGKAGIIMQVPKRQGCQMIAGKRARLATEEEVAAFLEAEAEKAARIECQSYAQRVQVQVVAEPRGGNRDMKVGRK